MPVALKVTITCMAMLAVPAAAQPIQRAGQPAAPYTDSHSGMTFPAEVGTFRRINLTRGPGPRDMHAFYMHLDEAGRVSASVFLTDMTAMRPKLAQPCAAYEDASRSAAQMAHPGLLNPRVAPVMPGFSGAIGTGFTQSWSEPNGTAWISDKLHYCRDDGRWAVEYQFFYPAAMDGAVALETAFLSGFAWSVAQQ